MTKIRTRIAPSPTGVFHVGTARTALFNILFAKKMKGECLLRIEDTDQKRSKKEFEHNIHDAFSWLGFSFDGPATRSSEHTDRYRHHINTLIKNNFAYVAEENIIRFRNPGGTVTFADLIRGELAFDVGELGDFVIAKSMDHALYHLAVVVDDIESRITHVIRGEDHISNTPRQILILEALGAARPHYAHLPLILAPDRSKLSKRKHGETASIDFYRARGYLPEALVNYLALLGWNPGNEREIFSFKELIKEFSMDNIQKSGAIFDVQKLDWMNGEYIRRKSVKELIALAQPFLKLSLGPPMTQTKFGSNLEKIVKLEQPRLKKLSELPEKIDYFFNTPQYDKALLRWKKMSGEEIKKSLETSKEIINTCKKEFIAQNLENIFLNRIGEGDKGALLWPLRVALSGKKASPGPFEIMDILGQAESMERIKIALAKF